MALLNQKAFERKLQNMSSTQDSVQTVSLWMIHHKKHAEDMVAVWLEQLKKASKADRRLVLFYLANDVLQNSRKKGKEFSNAFTKILREAMLLLSDKNIKGSVQRVIKIWEERKLFESDYLEALRSRLDLGNVPVSSKKPKEKVVEKEKEKEVKPPKQKRLPPADFKPSKLIDALKALRNFEGELTLKESQLNSLRIDASDLESVRQLKDRTGGGKFCEEYELATTKLEEFSEILKREQQERVDLIKVLEDGEAFYDTSYGEVKVIVHAYKTFGNRLTSLKKKVDAKVNRLAQKAAEKAKTGPVSAPQASFLTSGLPDVGEESASSTPSQTQPEEDKSLEEGKSIDPTVDNIEVADMDIEDDSDSEKSETSEETSAEDPKSSNDQTPNSTASSDSQTAKSTPQELEKTVTISSAVSTAPAQPLAPTVGAMMSLQGSILAGQPPIVTPQPAVGMVIRPFIGVQGFPGPAPQFRPGVPPMQPTPGMPQNPLLQPVGALPGHGQIPSQGQPFAQMPRPPGLLPRTTVPIPGALGTIQPFPLARGFVRSQAPLPVAATTVPVPVQLAPNSAPSNETSQGSGGLPQDVVKVGSPDSEASAPSPVGSPELHLEEGDETPETTPAPLGDVDVNDKTGFDTNESFFDNPVKNPTISSGISVSSSPSVAKTFLGSPSSSNSTPSNSDQVGGQHQDAALTKKDNGQKVTAVDILAQLLSRGRKLQETAVQVSPSAPMSVNQPVGIPPVAPETSGEHSGNPPSKPLLSLIDSLFPKLSDSLKTLKEKEKSGNPAEAQSHPASAPVVNAQPSLPACPLASEGQFQEPPSDVSEPPIEQTELRSILKKGPKGDKEMMEFGSNHADDQDAHCQDPGPGTNEDTSLPTPTTHGTQPGMRFRNPPVRGSFPPLPQKGSFERPSEILPHRPPPFGPRGPFHGPRGASFDQSGINTGPSFSDGPPDMHGHPHVRVPPGHLQHGRSPRGPPDVNEQVPPYGPPHMRSPRGPPFERHRDDQADKPGQVSTEQPPNAEQVPPHRQPNVSSPRGLPVDTPDNAVPDQSPRGHSPRGSLKDSPAQRPSDTSHILGQPSKDPTPSLVGPQKSTDVPVDEKHPSNMEKASFINGPPGFRRFPRDGPHHRPHEQMPRSDGPPPHRTSFPGVTEDKERRREFEHWEEYRTERYRDHVRGPWQLPHDHPGGPPPDWRPPPVSPRGDPNRADFREDDPSLWTSFENPGKSPGRHLGFSNRTVEGFREGPPGLNRFRDYGPPGRRRHSLGDFEGEWVRYPGPLKRPGPPPVPFPGPSKRPYY